MSRHSVAFLPQTDCLAAVHVPLLTNYSNNSSTILCRPVLISLPLQKSSPPLNMLQLWYPLPCPLPKQSPHSSTFQSEYFATFIQIVGAATLPCLMHLEYLAFIFSSSAAIIHPCTPLSFHTNNTGLATSKAVLTSKLADYIVPPLSGSPAIPSVSAEGSSPSSGNSHSSVIFRLPHAAFSSASVPVCC